MPDLLLTHFVCSPQPAVGGGYRVSARVQGRPVVGWVNTYMSQPTPAVAASMIAQAQA